MNREFKFRARWKDTGKIIPDYMKDYLIDALNDNVFIVEQYTGLKDKNGVEIYEGDIVDFYERDDIGDETFSGQVAIKFKDGAFEEMNNARLTQSDANDCEVIGNIHENK